MLNKQTTILPCITATQFKISNIITSISSFHFVIEGPGGEGGSFHCGRKRKTNRNYHWLLFSGATVYVDRWMLFDEICCVSQKQLSLTLASHKEKVQQAMTTPYHHQR